MIQKLYKVFGKRIVDLALITLGCFIVGFGFNAFLLPNRIVSGGLTGLSILAYEVFGWTPSVFILIANIFLFSLSVIFLGKEVLLKSIFGSLLVPLFISLFSGLQIEVSEPILASIFGGSTVGLGIGLVFLGNGSTGGTDLLALLLQKITNLRIAILLALTDGLVILCALIVYDVQAVLVALIALYLSSRMVDTVQVGPDTSKNIFIISNQYEIIGTSLVNEHNFGITYIAVEGGLNKEAKKMIMSVIREEQFIELKQLVLDIDPEAFITIASTHEVVGRGFTLFDTEQQAG